MKPLLAGSSWFTAVLALAISAYAQPQQQQERIQKLAPLMVNHVRFLLDDPAGQDISCAPSHIVFRSPPADLVQCEWFSITAIPQVQAVHALGGVAEGNVTGWTHAATMTLLREYDLDESFLVRTIYDGTKEQKRVILYRPFLKPGDQSEEAWERSGALVTAEDISSALQLAKQAVPEADRLIEERTERERAVKKDLDSFKSVVGDQRGQGTHATVHF